jgi:hypothetical protein
MTYRLVEGVAEIVASYARGSTNVLLEFAQFHAQVQPKEMAMGSNFDQTY